MSSSVAVRSLLSSSARMCISSLGTLTTSGGPGCPIGRSAADVSDVSQRGGRSILPLRRISTAPVRKRGGGASSRGAFGALLKKNDIVSTRRWAPSQHGDRTIMHERTRIRWLATRAGSNAPRVSSRRHLSLRYDIRNKFR